MFDIDTQISKMVSQLPQPPAAVLPKDMCDKPFMAPQAPAHYVLKAFGNNPDVCIHTNNIKNACLVYNENRWTTLSRYEQIWMQQLCPRDTSPKYCRS